MPAHIVKDKRKIRETVRFLVSRERRITIQIEGHETSFTSRIIKIINVGIYTRSDEGSKLIIGRLTPEKGNALIKSGAQLTVKFSLRNTSCRFNIRYLGTSRDYPYIGVIISFPEAIHIEERRRRDRRNDAIPAFDSGIFKLKKGSVKDKTYEFRVINCSAGGVGIQVGEKDSDLLERVKEGDKLQDITLYAPQTVVRMDGTVRHKSKIRDMENENSYILGVEFDETLKDFSSL